MKAHFHSPFQWVMVWSVLWSLPIRGEPLSRGEIAKLGKATTAFVDVKPGRGSGSAFCIHSSGLFLTNEHVIRSADNGGSIDLVLNSGLKERRIISATVVRANKDLDLALLRVEGVEKLPSLNLGSADDLTELMELVAFGFPFGAALAPQKQEYPAISVNVGNVTSLRRKEEDLHRIQMDAALNPGNSGGPVLDRNGKVVGMVVSGVQGSGVNFAIPVNHMRRFLAEPFIHFKLPVLSRADIHKSLVFEIRAMPLLPSPSPLSIELSLSTPDGKEQKHQMDKDKEKDTYRLETVAFPPPTSPQNLQVVVQLASGSISGTVEDRIFTLGNRQHRLIEVNRIRTQPQGQVLFQDGYIMEGVLGGMDAVPIRFAKQEFKVNFHRAAEVLVEPPAEIDSVTCTIVVSQGGKEVARQQKNLTVSGPRHSHRKRSPPIQVPLLEKESVIRHLPATIGNVAVGGSGRYLILHLPQIRKLAVFDVNLARVVHYLALAEDNIKFTAGAEEILVVLVNSNLLQRWSLTTFERKAIVPLPTKGIVKAMCMGSASIGPVLIHSSDNVLGPRELPCLFLDLKTLKSFKNRFSGIMNFFPHETLEFRASADGRVFTVWRTSGNPSGMGILTWTEEEYRGAYHHDNYSHVIPGPDGQMLFTGRGVFTNKGKAVSNLTEGNFYPSVEGNYFFNLRPADSGLDLALTLYFAGDNRPLIRLPKIEGLTRQDPNFIGDWEKRIFLLPEAKVLIIIPSSLDRLLLHRFDVEEKLTRSGVDYLFVASQPPTTIQKGQTYRYQLIVRSRKGDIWYKLEAGPKGMILSKTGQVTWAVPPDFREKEYSVLVTVRDASGQECYHTFSIDIRE